MLTKLLKRTMDKKRINFYIWLGVIYLALRVFSDLVMEPETSLERSVNHAWLVPFLVGVNIFFFEYALPLFKLSWKRILLALLLVFVFCMIYSYGLYAWRLIGIQLHVYTAIGTFDSVEATLEHLMSYSMGTLFFFAIVKHVYDYRNLKISAQQLRIEKQLAELNYLKSQTNPHFLFNTLNNIYSLARDRSALAPEAIMRLSKILRFMLYETSGDYISIEQELQMISDYIALEKLRYDDSLHVNYYHDIEDMKQALPPLLLIPLVENAFKHGVSETRVEPFIDIYLSVKDRQLSFLVKNSTEQFSAAQGVKENIGLSNLRRQLELLYTDYDLEVLEEELMFTAHLKINLAEHV